VTNSTFERRIDALRLRLRLRRRRLRLRLLLEARLDAEADVQDVSIGNDIRLPLDAL